MRHTDKLKLSSGSSLGRIATIPSRQHSQTIFRSDHCYSPSSAWEGDPKKPNSLVLRPYRCKTKRVRARAERGEANPITRIRWTMVGSNRGMTPRIIGKQASIKYTSTHTTLDAQLA